MRTDSSEHIEEQVGKQERKEEKKETTPPTKNRYKKGIFRRYPGCGHIKKTRKNVQLQQHRQFLCAMEMPDLTVPLEGFEDVTPIPQDDGDNPVVFIAYPHNCEYGTGVIRFGDEPGLGRLTLHIAIFCPCPLLQADL